MAAKFTTRPAAVRREKKDAAMGAIAISAHSVAASMVAITRNTGRLKPAPTGFATVGAGFSRPVTGRLKAAPTALTPEDDSRGRAERQQEAGVEDAHRDSGNTKDPGDGDDVQRRATVIDNHRAQKNHRAGDGARNGRRTAGDLRVEQQDENGHQRSDAIVDAGRASDEHEYGGENRDVPAGYRNDVVRAGVLKPPFVFVRKAGPIADENRNGDRGGGRMLASDVLLDLGAHPRARRGRQFLERRAVSHHLDQRRTFYRPEERNAAARQRFRFIRDAWVLERRRLAQKGGHAHRTSGAPPLHRGRRHRSDHGQPDATVHVHDPPCSPNPADVDYQ